MDLYSKPIDEISYTDIEDFLQRRQPESAILDYKCKLPKDLERLLAAFANTNGGIVIVGVDEDESSRPTVPAVGVDLTGGEDAIKRRIASQAYDAIYPPICPEVAVCAKPDDPQRGIVLIRVSESSEPPHATDDRQRVYVRVGTQNRFVERQANLDELEWLWNRRRRSEQFRERMIEQARERVALLLSSARSKTAAQNEGIVECYGVPRFPRGPLLDLAEVNRFATQTMTCSGARDMLYAEFPWSSVGKVRPVADGIAILSSEEHVVQINQWGMLHSHLLVEPAKFPEESLKPLYYPEWFIAHLDAFLRYLHEFIVAFVSLQQTPLFVSITLKFPSSSAMIRRGSVPFGIEERTPISDTELQVLEKVLMPTKLMCCRGDLLAEGAQRLLCTAGFGFAVDEKKVRQWLSRFLGDTSTI